jgi:hypothetical protein
VADVTVCIPAFAAEAFIDRTLEAVRAGAGAAALAEALAEGRALSADDAIREALDD